MSSFGVPFPATFGGGVAAPSVQEFDCFVVVDFEATCDKGVRIYPQEIIEFPAVLVDGATGSFASVFRSLLDFPSSCKLEQQKQEETI